MIGEIGNFKMKKLLLILLCLPLIGLGQKGRCESGDCKNGFGTYVWNSGSKYVGNFLNHERHGYGRKVFASGKIWDGDWAYGKFIRGKKTKGSPPMIDLSVKGKIQTFVEKRVNEWQQKGEFEKTNDYLVRVNEKNRKVKIKKFQQAAMESLKLDFLNSIDFSNIELGDYDADNETFLLKDSKLGNLVISVPINEAKLFKNNFSYIQFTDQKFVITDDKFVLSYLELSLSLQASSAPNIYTYNLSNTQDYAITDIDYEFSSIEIDDIKSSKTTKSSNISTNKLKVGTTILL